MKSVWTVFKESVSEWVRKWWFILSLFTVPILGLFISFVGFTLARLEDNERLKEAINYGWFTHIYTAHFPYPSTTQFTLRQIILWLLQKSIALFLIFLVLYFLLGIIPTLKKPDTRHRKLLLKTGIAFFVANIFLDVVYMMIMKRFDSQTLINNLKTLELTTNFLHNLFSPVSTVTFILIGIISLLLGREFTEKPAAKIVAFLYIISLLIFIFSIPGTFVRSPEFQPFISGTLTFLTFIAGFILTTLSYYFYIPIAKEDNFKNAVEEGFELIKMYPELIWIFLVFFALLSGISVSFSYITYNILALRNQVISQILTVILISFEYFIGAMMLITIYKLINNMLGETNNLAGRFKGFSKIFYFLYLDF